MAALRRAECRRRPWRAPVSLFVLACLAGLVAWAPAAWLQPVLPDELVCTELNGTVWRGECRDAQRVDSFGTRTELGRLRWQLSAGSLFRLALEAKLDWQLQNSIANAEVRRKLSGAWQVRDLRWESDYQSLSLLADRDLRRLWLLVPRSQGISLKIPLASGNAKEIEQLSAELRFSAFGEHALIVRPDGSGELRSSDGPLQLTGPLEWQRDGRYRLAVKIRVKPDADASLRNALASFGATNTQGDYDLTIDGSIWTLLR
ncbi:MAG: Type secretion system protein [Pseudomonadota bacterium]